MKYFLTLTLLFAAITFSKAQNSKKIFQANKISNFSGLDEEGNNWNSDSVTTDFLVVYFYPAAMTSGCTKQACAYRDDKANFDKLGATVIGISGDEVKNLKHFKDSYQLNFPLISDNNGEISKIFKVPTSDGGSINREIEGENYLLVRGITTPRWTFVLDKERNIIYKNANVNASEDSKKVKELINSYLKK